MNDDNTIVDLDEPAAAAEPAECTCGARRTLMRYFEIRVCHSRALARLRRAHPEEYTAYLDDEKRCALDTFEAKWRRHLAGDHSG